MVPTACNFKWNAKGDFALTALRFHFADHLKLGGKPDDQIGMQIIGKFIDTLMLSPDFVDVIQAGNFDRDNLIDIVVTATNLGIEGELPSPCVQDGFPMPIGCVLVQRKEILIHIIQEVNKRLGPDSTAFDKVNAIIEATIPVAKAYYATILIKNGPADFTIDASGKGVSSPIPPGGCVGLIGLMGAMAGLMGLWVVLAAGW